MTAGQASADDADRPLNVTVVGDKVLIHLPDGSVVRMSVSDAEASASRLMDAAIVAQGRIPEPRRQNGG